MQSKGTGRAVIPRYGGGWMHQFGYVYSLQHELLNPDLNNWFRALELWHAARAEGVAMNVAHYNQILRTCVKPGKWDQALMILNHMKKEGLRPDVVGVGSALSACANVGKAKEAQEIFDFYFGKRQMKPDSHCFHALMVAKKKSGDGASVDDLLAISALQQREGIPLAQPQYVALLEACTEADDKDKAMAVVEMMRTNKVALPEKAMPLLEKMRVEPPMRALGSSSGTRLKDDAFRLPFPTQKVPGPKE